MLDVRCEMFNVTKSKNWQLFTVGPKSPCFALALKGIKAISELLPFRDGEKRAEIADVRREMLILRALRYKNYYLKIERTDEKEA